MALLLLLPVTAPIDPNVVHVVAPVAPAVVTTAAPPVVADVVVSPAVPITPHVRIMATLLLLSRLQLTQ